MAILAVVLAGL